MSEESAAAGRIAILGGGNLGGALARGWIVRSGMAADCLTVTRRNPDRLAELAGLGCEVTSDNVAAVVGARTIVVAVQPQQLHGLLDEIGGRIDPARHRII